MESYVNVIGAGLAGVECAYQLSKFGLKVKLYEMLKDLVLGVVKFVIILEKIIISGICVLITMNKKIAIISSTSIDKKSFLIYFSISLQKVVAASVIWSLIAAIITIFSKGALYFFKFVSNLIADKYGTGNLPTTFASLMY